jgi:hypothetical protein
MARLLLEFSHPRAAELDTVETEALDQHLLDCADCARSAQGEHIWDATVGSAMCQVPVPPGLRERLLGQLEREQSEDRRRRLRRLMTQGALAASLLAAVLFGWHWRQTHPPRLDLETLAYQFFCEGANPSAEKVEEFFQRKDWARLVPKDFNYRLLTHYYWAELQGRRVPLLLFTQGATQARVFLLSATQFDLEALQADEQVAGSGCKVEVRLAPNHQGAQLILYSGDSLDPFLVAHEAQNLPATQ